MFAIWYLEKRGLAFHLSRVPELGVGHAVYSDVERRTPRRGSPQAAWEGPGGVIDTPRDGAGVSEL